MAGTNLGTAYVTIMPSAKGMGNALSSQMQTEGGSAGKLLGGSIASTAIKAIAASGIVAAVGKLFKDAISEGAKLEQSFGGLDTIYGDAADAMKEMAYEASQAGLSANDYAEQAVSMGASLKQAFGGDAKQAAKAANTAILDMADNAAKMGTDIGAIQNAYQGFAKQNYTMLDNLKLGYGGTKQEMERLLEDAEKLTGVHYDINNLGDVYEAIHVIQGELGLTGVAAEEGAETFSGSMAAMKASAQNLVANMALGEDIKQPLQSLLESTKNFLFGNLFPMIGNVLKQLPGLIGEALLWAFDNIPNMIDAAIEFMNNLAKNIQEGSGAFKEKLVEIGKAALEMMKDIDWKGLGLAIINLIWTGLQELGLLIWEGLKWVGQTAWEKMKSVDWLQLGKNIILIIWLGLSTLGSMIWEKLKSIGESAWEKLKSIDWLELGKTVIKTIWEGLVAIGSWIWEKLQTIGDTAVEKVTEIDWKQLGLDIITWIWNGLVELGNTIWEKLQELGNTAVEKVKEIDWKQLGIDIITFIGSGITSIGSSIWEGLGAIGKKAWDWITGNDSESGVNWKDGGETVVTEFSNGMKSGAFNGTIQNATSVVADTVMSGLNNINTYGIGANAMLGIVQGMNDYVHYAQEVAIGMANFVTAAFTGVRAFSINSPSKTMRDKVGKPISEGIAVGIEEGAGMINSAIDRVARSSVSDFNMDVSHGVSFDQMDGEGAEAESPITINVYPSAGMDERALADMVQQRLALAQRQRLAAWGTA